MHIGIVARPIWSLASTCCKMVRSVTVFVQRPLSILPDIDCGRKRAVCPLWVIRDDLACRQHVRLRGNIRNAACPAVPVEGIGLDVIQAPKRRPPIMRYDLTDFEPATIRLLRPNRP